MPDSNIEVLGISTFDNHLVGKEVFKAIACSIEQFTVMLGAPVERTMLFSLKPRCLMVQAWCCASSWDRRESTWEF